MNSEKQTRIEQRAYALWQAEGQPAGKHEQHWLQAARDVEAEENGSSRGEKTRSQRSSGRAKVNSRSSSPEKREKARA